MGRITVTDRSALRTRRYIPRWWIRGLPSLGLPGLGLASLGLLLALSACGPSPGGGSDDASAQGDAALTDSGPGPQDGAASDARPATDADPGADAGEDAGPPPCVGDPVAVFDTYEVALHSSSAYSGTSGSPNPFVDVTVTATVQAPDGRTFDVEGFYDGDGAGGADGDVFKIRVAVDQAGPWTWTSHSATAGLDGQTGTICGQGLLPGVFGAGPVVVNPGAPRTFQYATGVPVYLIGKFLDTAAPSPIQFSHTFLSEQLSDVNRQQMLDRHVAMHLNKMNVYLANRGDYHSVSTTPWVGSASSNDKARFDLARWHTYDQWIVALRDAGLVAQLWFFADDSGFGDLPDADRQRLIRYGMARLSAYANTMFTLCLEWQEGWSTSEVDSHAIFLQSHNPWDRLASVHGTTGDFAFPNAAWADYMDIQSGNDAPYAAVHAMGLTNRALAAKPLLNEEFGLGDETDELRRRAWAAFTAGAGGSGTGAYLQHLADFVSTIPFETLAPNDALVQSGEGYCLADPGTRYVVYLPHGGGVGLDLTAASGSLQVAWYDPRSGSTTPGASATGGTVQTMNAPDGNDWVLSVWTP